MELKPVKRPERTVIVHNNGTDYVYFTEYVKYSPDLKASRPKRVAIGKLNEEGLLIPNANYVRLFGEVGLKEPCERADYVSVGPQFVMSKIVEKYDMRAILDCVFEEDADKILDVATYMVMSENNVMQYFEDYGYRHTLFSVANFTDNTIGNLFEKLKVKDIDVFIKAWVNRNIKQDIYIAYDSTNMNTTAGQIELAEYGHAKDDERLPQVNVSLGYSQSEQLPLFYELYPGSIVDNSECGKMVERAKYYGCENVGFILDRGYFTKGNIRYFEENGYSYMIMTKGNAKFIQEIITEYGAKVKNGGSHYLASKQIYGMTTEIDLFKTGQKEYVHLYYNGVQAEKEKIMINERWIMMDKQLEEKKQKKLKRREEVKQYEGKYKISFDENGYFTGYQRKEKEMRKQLEKAGYFVIITSKKMDAAEAIERYRERDAIEKVFRMDKSYLGNEVFRVHTDTRLESKMFISFIALILRNEIYQGMKKLYQKNRKEYTVPQVLRELERMGVTKLSDEKYHIRYALTSKQKKILKAMNSTEKEYMAYARSVKIPLEN